MSRNGKNIESTTPMDTQATGQKAITDMNQLLAYIQNLEQQIRGLQNASTTATTTTARTTEPAKPPNFGGKSGESIDTWIFRIDQQFLLDPATDEKKVLIAVTYLTDNAATWWRHVYEENAQRSVVWSWNDFKNNIKTQFKPLDAEKIAQNRLNNLRQTASVAAYINNFRNLLLDIPTMAEGDRIEQFLRGLKPDIHERVALQGPGTLNEACTMANTIDAIHFQIRTQNYTQPPTSVNADSTPMEVNGIRRTKLTDAERDKLRKAGACFFCREVGHMSKQCPRRKKKTIAAVELELEDLEEGKDEA